MAEYVHRRDVLRWLAAGAPLATAGCTGSRPWSSGDGFVAGRDAGRGEGTSCDEYVYRPIAADEDDAYPWELHFRNIGLSVYSVAIEIIDRSGETSEPVVSCTATSEEHAELVFDLVPDTQYRVHATLHRPDSIEEASTTVSGAQVQRANAALEVSVDRSEGFAIRFVHYDPGIPVTPTP